MHAQGRRLRPRRQSLAPQALPNSRPSLSAPPDSVLDLKHLEAYCQRTAHRCSTLEDSVASLQHDIQAKLSQWDSMLSALSETDDKARALTDQLSRQLQSLRANTTPQVTAARNEVVHSKERVKGSEEQLVDAEGSIERAKEALLRLERKLAEEEATLRKIESWQRALVWLALIAIALLGLLIAWLAG